MIRFRLKELIARKEFERERRITLDEIAAATGIHRTTLSKIGNVRGYNTSTDNLESLCRFLECEISDLVEIVPPIESAVTKKD